MKKSLLLIICGLIVLSVNLYSADDTLRYWTPGTVTNIPNATNQFAIFYPDKPCFIKQITVHFFGASGTATVVLLGSEGGSNLPEEFVYTNPSKILAVWQNINVPTQQGSTTPMQLTLKTPVWMPHNRFFVGVVNLSSGLYLATDKTNASPTCESIAGIDTSYYFYQVLFNPGDPQNLWQYGLYHYAMDAIVNYPAQTPSTHLVDVTSQVGIPIDIPNTSSAWADIDGDGYQDLLVNGRLFKNNNGHFTEITSQVGLSGRAGGNAFVDMNNDGFMDILLLQTADGSSEVYLNDGNMNFTKKKLAIRKLDAISCFSIADINYDNYPDIFIGQYWTTPPTGLPNYFYYNTKTNDFILQQGMLTTTDARPTLGSQFVDFDNDGDLDLYVANYNQTEDEFYQNNNGVFTNIITQKGIDQNNDPKLPQNHDNATGVSWYDYNNDGNMDLLLPQENYSRFLPTDHRGTTIYKNLGPPNYNFENTYNPTTYVSSVGIDMEETQSGGAWGDPNNDGLADFITTAYFGCRYVTFYQQNANHTFDIKTWDYQLDGISTYQDACWVDFNNDGKVDLSMSNNTFFRLYENEFNTNNKWIEIDLTRQDTGKLNTIGARVKVISGGNTYMQEVTCGQGQKMQRPYRLHFGLGFNNTIDSILVRWPGKKDWETFQSDVNVIVNLIEGKGGEYQLPVPPVLTYPDNNATGVPLKNNLSWNPVQSADKYQLQISAYSIFYPIFVDDTISTTQYPLSSLLNFTPYWWRVRTHNLSGWSDWSETRTFETEEQASVLELTGQAAQYYLKDNKPNPFSQNTTVEFGLPVSQYVSLKIIDQMGNVISENISQNLGAGNYKININASEMPSGIYYYQLYAGNFVSTKKFIVVK